MKKKAFTGLFIVAIILLACVDAEADSRKRMHSVPFDSFTLSEAFADDDSYPYGRSKKGRYGEKSTVMTEDKAREILKEYFQNNVTIGKVKERKFYFEAEIRDKHGNLIDRVIIDRRTGRIRSVY